MKRVIGHCGDCGGTEFVLVERCLNCECEEQVDRYEGGAEAPAPREGSVAPFDGVEPYYARLFRQIKQRREDNPPSGTGGDFDCLVAMVEWLWEQHCTTNRVEREL